MTGINRYNELFDLVNKDRNSETRKAMKKDILGDYEKSAPARFAKKVATGVDVVARNLLFPNQPSVAASASSDVDDDNNGVDENSFTIPNPVSA